MQIETKKYCFMDLHQMLVEGFIPRKNMFSQVKQKVIKHVISENKTHEQLLGASPKKHFYLILAIFVPF